MTQVTCSEAVIQAAISQIGTVESPSGSNQQKYGEWYGMNGVAWCAIFISWCFAQGGQPLPSIDSARGYSLVRDAVSWAKANGLFRAYGSGYVPKRGDIIFYSWTGGPAEHTGIELDHMADGREHTVEGNTSGAGSQANGGEVMEKYRRGSIVGWLSTTWVGAPVAPSPQPIPNTPNTPDPQEQELMAAADDIIKAINNSAGAIVAAIVQQADRTIGAVQDSEKRIELNNQIMAQSVIDQLKPK